MGKPLGEAALPVSEDVPVEFGPLELLGCVVCTSMTAYGLRVGLRASDPAGLDLLLERLPRVCKPSTVDTVDRLYSFVLGDRRGRGERRYHVLYEDGKRIARTTDLGIVLLAFQDKVEVFLAERARARVFVHAAVVGSNGRAVVLPGRSQTGKTTLVAELVRRGALYLSDEFAVFDAQGRVHPFPRPLGIRERGKLRPTEVEALGGKQGKRALPVGLVVVSPYDEGRRAWRPRTLPPGRAVLELLRYAVPARREPERTMATLEQVVAGAEVVKGARGDAGEAADAILRRLQSSSR